MSGTGGETEGTELGNRIKLIREAVLNPADDADVLLLTDAIVADETTATQTKPPAPIAGTPAPVDPVAEVLLGSDDTISAPQEAAIRAEVRAWLEQHGAELIRQCVTEQRVQQSAGSAEFTRPS